MKSPFLKERRIVKEVDDPCWFISPLLFKIHISSFSNSREGHSHPKPGETVLQSFTEFELEFERFLLFLYSTFCLDTLIGLCLSSSTISWYKIWKVFFFFFNFLLTDIFFFQIYSDMYIVHHIPAYYFFFFWHAACGILVPQPGIEPVPAAMEGWSLNHWTTREVPGSS